MPSPVYLSPPLYCWEKSSWNDSLGNTHSDHVGYDRRHGRVIHQHEAGIYAIDCSKKGTARDGLLVSWKKPCCSIIVFSPDGGYFAYCLANQELVGIAAVLNSVDVDIKVPLQRSSLGVNNPFYVLDVLWLPQVSQDYAQLVVVSSHGIEMFNFHYESEVIKATKKFHANAKHSWAEACSGFVVLSVGPRSLQPYVLFCKCPTKLPLIELNLPRCQSLEHGDVDILTIYETTYCVHKDSSTGRVSLRCISATSQPDSVLDTGGPGNMTISLIDDLLYILRRETNMGYIFEIKSLTTGIVTSQYQEKSVQSHLARALGPLCKPFSLVLIENHDSECDTDIRRTINLKIDSTSCEFFAPNIVIDHEEGCVYHLDLRLDCLVSRIVHDKNSKCLAIQVLLRRTKCKGIILELLSSALKQKDKFEDICLIFATLSASYRETIGRSPAKKDIENQAKSTVALASLLQSAGKHSVITEKDVVLHILYPLIVEKHALKSGQNLFDAAMSSRIVNRFPEYTENILSEQYNEHDSGGLCSMPILTHRLSSPNSLDHCITSTVGSYWFINKCLKNLGVASKPGGNGYLLSCTIEYVRSLLNQQILPHRVLQLFLFDLCLLCHREDLVRQLLQYHILLDSIELTDRLYDLWLLTGYEWAEQSCLDMAQRTEDWATVVDILIKREEYLKIIPLLKRYKVSSFPIHDILKSLGENIAVQKKKPDLFADVLDLVRVWHLESIENKPVSPPNLKDCRLWFPDLKGTDLDAQHRPGCTNMTISSTSYTGQRITTHVKRYSPSTQLSSSNMFISYEKIADNSSQDFVQEDKSPDV